MVTLPLDYKINKTTFVVAVPSEKLVEEKINAIDLEAINLEGQTFKVIDFYSYSRRDIFPVGLMHLATGMSFTPTAVWRKYHKSDRLYFFIIQKEKENEK